MPGAINSRPEPDEALLALSASTLPYLTVCQAPDPAHHLHPRITCNTLYFDHITLQQLEQPLQVCFLVLLRDCFNIVSIWDNRGCPLIPP